MTKEFEAGMTRLDALIFNLDQGWECPKDTLIAALKDIKELLEK